MSEFKVKLAEDNAPQDVEKSVEETVIEKAVESGEVAPEVAGIEPEDGVHRINLDQINQQDDAIQERETEAVDVGEQTTDGQGVDEQVRVEPSEEVAGTEEESGDVESPIEIIEDEPVEQDVPEPSVSVDEPVQTDNEESSGLLGGDLPDGVDKLVEFMKETGGTVEDYLRLNRDIDSLDGVELLREQYLNENPDLTGDEVGFLLNDEFGYDPDVDDERIIKKKQIAFKKAVNDAKRGIKQMRDKYYEDLKYSRPTNLTDEAKEAIKYYEQSQEQAKISKAIAQDLQSKTDKYFNDFKGFEFKLGDKKVRYKVNDIARVKKANSDFSQFTKAFSDENGYVTKPDVYHKTLYAAQNIDKIAQHFYDQGRADAVKESAKKAKNIDMGVRQDANAIKTSDGTKVRVVSGDDSGKLRFKLRNYNR